MIGVGEPDPANKIKLDWGSSVDNYRAFFIGGKMELRYLSSVFYQKYKDCTEILSKGETRPYIILIIEVENNKFAIPIRTNLHKTKDCYETNPKTNSGLDYTKAVVISRNDYIDSTKYCTLQYFNKELGIEWNKKLTKLRSR